MSNRGRSIPPIWNDIEQYVGLGCGNPLQSKVPPHVILTHRVISDWYMRRHGPKPIIHWTQTRGLRQRAAAIESVADRNLSFEAISRASEELTRRVDVGGF